MTNTDRKIYKAMLNLLKGGFVLNKMSVAREAKLSRQTVYNKIEKYTFQDLDKYRIN